jgi:Flp pilus assembly pilin Flp
MRKFIDSETGATAVEYAMLLGTIAVPIIGAVMMMGRNMAVVLGEVATAIANALAAAL